MATLLDIKLKKADKVYHEGENITGLIVINTPTDLKHDGIYLIMEGSVNLQLSSKNVGILEAFYNSVKPIQLLSITCEVSTPGKVPAGLTEIPFELPLRPKQNRELFETYQGVFINISYNLKCDIKRSFLSKDIQRAKQFLVQYYPKQPEPPLPSIYFKISPDSLAAGGAGAPQFSIRGKLDSTRCSLTKPLTGYIVVENCATPIRSLEIQLVRVETCGCAEGYARDEEDLSGESYDIHEEVYNFNNISYVPDSLNLNGKGSSVNGDFSPESIIDKSINSPPDDVMIRNMLNTAPSVGSIKSDEEIENSISLSTNNGNNNNEIQCNNNINGINSNALNRSNDIQEEIRNPVDTKREISEDVMFYIASN